MARTVRKPARRKKVGKKDNSVIRILDILQENVPEDERDPEEEIPEEEQQPVLPEPMG